MNHTSLHDMELDINYIAIPYFSIILSIFVYMICQCNTNPQQQKIKRELYMKV